MAANELLVNTKISPITEHLLVAANSVVTTDKWHQSEITLNNQQTYLIPLTIEANPNNSDMSAFLVRCHGNQISENVVNTINQNFTDESNPFLLIHELSPRSSIILLTQIDGMRCGSCVNKIEASLSELQTAPSIVLNQCKVYLNNKLAITEFSSSNDSAYSTVTITNSVNKHIKTLGFSVTAVGHIMKTPNVSGTEVMYNRSYAVLHGDSEQHKTTIDHILKVKGKIHTLR